MKFVIVSVAKKKRTHLVRFLCWMAVVLYLGIIFALSNQDGTSSNSFSDSIVNAVRLRIKLPAAVSDGNGVLVLNYNVIFREMAHFVEYFILAFLIYIALYFCRVDALKNIFITLVICFTCACFDEIHQSFVPDRSPVIKDIVIDMAGSTLWLAFSFCMNMIRNRMKYGVFR